MTSNPPEPFPSFTDTTSASPKASAAELQAKYQQIKRRQRILAIIGIALLILLYIFLRYVAPAVWGGGRPSRKARWSTSSQISEPARHLTLNRVVRPGF